MNYINAKYIAVFHDRTASAWDVLASDEQELLQGSSKIDFSMITAAEAARARQSVAEAVVSTSVKALLSPFAAIRWGMQRAAMAPIYPAQSDLVKQFVPDFQLESIDKKRKQISNDLCERHLHVIISVRTEIAELQRKIQYAEQERLKVMNPDPLQVLSPSLQAIRCKGLDQAILSYQQKIEIFNKRLIRLRDCEVPIVRHVTFETDGVRSSGVMIGTPRTMLNGKWVLQATGNSSPVENEASSFAYCYQKIGFNILLVNNPGVGRSEGEATPESMGATHNTAIEFLKTAVKAKEIVLAGYSIGGASIGQAILQRDFIQDRGKVDFLVLNQVTFAKMSNLVKHFVPSSRFALIASAAVRGFGCEMDNTAASKILAKHGIPEVMIQASEDNIVPWKYSLQVANARRGVRNATLPSPKPLKGAGHNDGYLVLVESCKHIDQWSKTPKAAAALPEPEEKD